MTNIAKKEMDTVLITGASGFVASHLLKELLQHRDVIGEIRTLDKLKLPEIPNFNHKHCICDLAEQEDVDEILPKALLGVTVVVHLAAARQDFTANCTYAEQYRDNVKATLNLLSCITSSPSPIKLIHLSDARCNLQLFNHYGPSEVSIDEKCAHNDAWISYAFGHYATTKYMGEAIVKESGISSIIIRPALTYGEGNDPFVAQVKAMSKKYPTALSYLNTGNARHEMVYAGNVAHSIICGLSKLREPCGKCETVYVTDQAFGVDMAEYIASITQTSTRKASQSNYYVLLLYVLFGYLINLIHSLDSLPSVNYTRAMSNFVYHFNTRKSVTYLGYKAKYDEQQSMKHTVKYLNS